MTDTLQFSLLSPFSVKARTLCWAFGLTPRITPEEGGPLTAARIEAKMQLAARGFGKCLHRNPSELEEFPLVPWLFPESGGYLCDSTEIGLYLERTHTGQVMPGDPATAFASRLIEEAVDEVGLYALHHTRWVTSGRTTIAMPKLAEEIAGSLGRPAASLFIKKFGPRQVRRLNYLFSVAPRDADFSDFPPNMKPPTRDGFPPTHELLDRIWLGMLDGVEHALSDGRTYLFGDGLTMADAALIGNLGSTLLVDPEAAEIMEDRAPHTVDWLKRNLDGSAKLGTDHALGEAQSKLLVWASEAFIPLMSQNAEAYQNCPVEKGGPRNEKAYNRGLNLFEGELMGHPYRTVVKDFQVKTHREILSLFAGLSASDKAKLAHFGVTLEP